MSLIDYLNRIEDDHNIPKDRPGFLFVNYSHMDASAGYSYTIYIRGILLDGLGLKGIFIHI